MRDVGFVERDACSRMATQSRCRASQLCPASGSVKGAQIPVRYTDPRSLLARSLLPGGLFALVRIRTSGVAPAGAGRYGDGIDQ
jgi:hypothetical protein